MMLWSPDDILTGLFIAVAILILIVLYHVLFIVVDLRKVMRRAEKVTGQVEQVIMKPLHMTDKILEWIMGYIESFEKEHSHKKHHKEIR